MTILYVVLTQHSRFRLERKK